MKLKLNTLTVGALLTVAALAPQAASAAQATTAYATGDLLLGFRLEGNPNVLVVNLGSASNYIPLSLGIGGTWNGNPKQIQFGVVPGTSTAVFSLAADLSAAFGPSWATNNLSNGTADLSWAVAGATSTANNSPISGVPGRSYFLTLAETTPGIQTTVPNSTNSSADSGPRGAIDGAGFAYNNNFSTVNSSVARINSATDSSTWSLQLGAQGANGFGGGWAAEQAFGSNTNAGPTNSVLDLYLNQGTTLNPGNSVLPNLFLGSFALSSTGQLTYGSPAALVPEPGTAALLGLGLAAVGFIRRRKPSTDNTQALSAI